MYLRARIHAGASAAAATAGILAVKRAVLQWAGHEQAGSVQLMQFLEANTTNWRHLALPESEWEAAAGLSLLASSLGAYASEQCMSTAPVNVNGSLLPGLNVLCSDCPAGTNCVQSCRHCSSMLVAAATTFSNLFPHYPWPLVVFG